MVRVKVIGACGYGGVGISELLIGHEQVKIHALVDRENGGKPISEIYPHLATFLDKPLVSPSDPVAQEPVDVVFMATPDGVGMTLAREELARGAKVIDYSGDFRFNTLEAFSDYASRIGRPTEHASPDLLPQAVYGIPELHRKEIGASARIVGNPGCFAVSCTLGLAPAVKAGLIDNRTIICDCKTAVSGAGKKPNPMFHFPARYENMNAYRLTGHQHVCEIERELGRLAGAPVKITFTAQVVPMCRGIMSTLYGRVNSGVTAAGLLEAYKEFYRGEPFVDVYPHSAAIGTAHVRGTNRVKLVVSLDDRTGQMRIVSHIDNLVKGQAGSAMQNMNVMFGLPETMGLSRAGMYP